MELQKKLKDQSGASILLALLFFLLCAMVGASVLMAAVSNAGKIKSNREEQQKYLLLSSALRLVCDELTSAEYIGKYDSFTVVEYTEDGDVDYQYTHYQQKTGEFSCDLSSVLPLLPELEYIFAHKFPPGGSGQSAGDDIYTPLNNSSVSAPVTHTLTLTVAPDDVAGLDSAENKVTVKVRLDEDQFIWLTATLGEKDDASGYVYTMEAQLTSQGGDPGFADAPSSEAGIEKQVKVTWTLALIAKKVAGNEEAGDGT